MITILNKHGIAASCEIFTSYRPNSRGGFDSDRCLECNVPWRSHKNIGPGWRERSEAQKVQLGMFPNIILGEN